MKKLVLSVLGMALLVSVASAQSYKPFKLGLGLRYAKPSDIGGGILLDLEPAYRINNDIAVVLRVESAVMAKISPDGSSANAAANGCYTANGQYYLGSSKARPYVGAGFGVFILASVSASDASAEVGGGTEVGFYPRLGLDIGHFNINMDYNLIAASESIVVDGTIGATTTGKIKNSYMGIRIGAYLFGGRR